MHTLAECGSWLPFLSNSAQHIFKILQACGSEKMKAIHISRNKYLETLLFADKLQVLPQTTK
jgi:hypothetical protein